MRSVHVVPGGVCEFAKARPRKDFPAFVREAYDHAIADMSTSTLQRNRFTP
jgi:hypothetical protein